MTLVGVLQARYGGRPPVSAYLGLADAVAGGSATSSGALETSEVS